MKKQIIVLTMLAVGVQAMPQDDGSLQLNTGSTEKGLKGLVRKVGTMIDSMSVSGVDRRYISSPDKPWQLIVKSSLNQSIVKMNTKGSVAGIDYEVSPYLKTEPSRYVGLWAGYRGYGLGYTVNVGGDKGSYLTFGATGGAYGLNVRIHSFENDSPHFDLNSDLIPEDYKENWKQVNLRSPIKVHTLIADGYYLFNGKHFSYAAAYDQSVIQKRSAGSFMVGAMYYYSNINYADDENAGFILLMDDIGRIKQWQISLGAGYAYNLVPCRGLLISAMFMPMVAVYDRHKTWRYGSNLRDQATDDITHDDDELPESDYRLKNEPLSVTDSHSPITINFDARLSLTYQWNRFFVNTYGQFSRFHFKDGSVKGTLRDWYVNASIGVRF